jgi:membrane fusion protein
MTHAENLFRDEVLTEALAAEYGAIRVAQPISNWLIVVAAVILSTSLLVYVIYGSVDKKYSVVGITQPAQGSLAVVAPNAGVLIQTFVKEGEVVRAQQPLFELTTVRQNNAGELTSLIGQQLKSRLTSLESERANRLMQDVEKQNAINSRLRNLALEESEFASEIELAKQRRELGQKTVDQYLSLQQVHFASAAQLQEKQENLIDLESRVRALVRSQLQLQATQLALETERKDLASRTELELMQIARAQATLKQEIAENDSRRSSTIVAPADGTLTTITYKSGQGILSGQVLATFVPGGASAVESQVLEVHLYVPSRTAGFIAKGQSVFLRYQAFAYQKFGLQRGVVTHVGDTPFAPNELPSNVSATILSNSQQSAQGIPVNEALYRVTVRPDFQYVKAYGKPQFLKAGMSLNADVIQERRFIWEWIVDPVRALKGLP